MSATLKKFSARSSSRSSSRPRPSSGSSVTSYPGGQKLKSGVSDDYVVQPPHQQVPRFKYQKSYRSLQAHILRVPRDGVTVNKVRITGNRFTVQGKFEKRIDLDSFAKNLDKPKTVDRKIKILTKTTKFAGRKTQHYLMKALSIWA